MKLSELDQSTQVILKVTFVVLVLGFLWVIRDIVLILLVALILSSAMEPLVDYLARHRIPRSVSVLAVYLLVVGFAVLVVSLIVPPIVEQLKILRDNWANYSTAFDAKVGGTFAQQLDLKNLLGGAITTDTGGGDTVLSRTFGVFSGLFSLITIMVISFYLVAEQRGMKQFIATVVPQPHQEFAESLIQKIQKKMGLWLLGQVILSCSIFLLTYLGLAILGVPNALLLAALAGLLELVPYVGPFISAIPAVFFAFLSGPALAVATAVMYLAVQKIEGYVLVPKIMEKTVGTSPLVVIVALLVGFKLAGIFGLLIAVPLSGAVTVFIQEFAAAKEQAAR